MGEESRPGVSILVATPVRVAIPVPVPIPIAPETLEILEETSPNQGTMSCPKADLSLPATPTPVCCIPTPLQMPLQPAVPRKVYAVSTPKRPRVRLFERYMPSRWEDCVAYSLDAKDRVREWFQSRIQFLDNTPRCLLLLGPSGCGKTALVKALCRQHDVTLTQPTGVDNMVKLSASVQQVSMAVPIGSRTLDAWLYTGVDGYVLYDPDKNKNPLKKRRCEEGMDAVVPDRSSWSLAVDVDDDEGGGEGSHAAAKADDGSNDDEDLGIVVQKRQRGLSKSGTAKPSRTIVASVPPAVSEMLDMMQRTKMTPAVVGVGGGVTKPARGMAPVIFTAHDCPTAAMQAIKASSCVEVIRLTKVPAEAIWRVLCSTVVKDARTARERAAQKLRVALNEATSSLGLGRGASAVFWSAVLRARRCLDKIDAELASEAAVRAPMARPTAADVKTYRHSLQAMVAQAVSRGFDADGEGEGDNCGRGTFRKHHPSPLKAVVSMITLNMIAASSDGDLRQALIALEAAMFASCKVNSQDKTLDVFQSAKLILDFLPSASCPARELSGSSPKRTAQMAPTAPTTHLLPPRTAGRFDDSESSRELDRLYFSAVYAPNTLPYVHSNMYASLQDMYLNFDRRASGHTPERVKAEKLASVMSMAADMADAWSSHVDTYERVNWRYGQGDGVVAQCALLGAIGQMGGTMRPPFSATCKMLHPMDDNRPRYQDTLKRSLMLKADNGKCPPRLWRRNALEVNEYMSVLRQYHEQLRTIRSDAVAAVRVTQLPKDEVLRVAGALGMDPEYALRDPIYVRFGVTEKTIKEYADAMQSACDKCGMRDRDAWALG